MDVTGPLLFSEPFPKWRKLDPSIVKGYEVYCDYKIIVTYSGDDCKHAFTPYMVGPTYIVFRDDDKSHWVFSYKQKFMISDFSDTAVVEVWAKDMEM